MKTKTVDQASVQKTDLRQNMANGQIRASKLPRQEKKKDLFSHRGQTPDIRPLTFKTSDIICRLRTRLRSKRRYEKKTRWLRQIFQSPLKVGQLSQTFKPVTSNRGQTSRNSINEQTMLQIIEASPP